ncbi:MAG TPA: NADH-quinone oxidoreductase subunit C [Bacteroidia bacterium]|nr:NADH-quinone oxidoreductase subunit C [Bacteroidia bacterium]HRS59285.1 NADH-quinone oxidoreductase subunit C [Bacteroidia bacterium]HRU67125.1 NADH-quinone oxidoreductase subunit C [Bacteroidia bacterium]
MNEEKFNILKEKFPSVEWTEGKNYPEITVETAELTSLCGFLKEDSRFAFDYLFNMTAVDWLEYFTLVYHLENTDTKDCIVVKTKLADRENAEAGSVYGIWPSAEFYEREVYDLFGVKFTGHPDLRRIFLEDDWHGHPLRKDYIDEINIIER